MFSELSHYINLFLKTEITCIPRLVGKYIGNYYNNALCNGTSWLFLLWFVLHLSFDTVLDAFLKRIKYKEYIRARLSESLWYLSFAMSALLYSAATLFVNEVELFNFKRMHVPSETDFHAEMGYALLCSFYLHTALWKGLRNGAFVSLICYLLLSLFYIFTYILRIVEIAFTLSALVSIWMILTEVTRITVTLGKHESFVIRMVTKILYFLSLGTFVAVVLFIIPFTYIVPLGLKIISDYPNDLLTLTFLTLVSWVTFELYESVLFKMVNHWLYHTSDTENVVCNGTIINCSLFPPRNDVAFSIEVLRKEIKEREAKMMSLRKPKSRNVLIQTLKCMVAIKRKLNSKRLSDSSESDSEKSSLTDEKDDLELESDDELENEEGRDGKETAPNSGVNTVTRKVCQGVCNEYGESDIISKNNDCRPMEESAQRKLDQDGSPEEIYEMDKSGISHQCGAQTNLNY